MTCECWNGIGILVVIKHHAFELLMVHSYPNGAPSLVELPTPSSCLPLCSCSVNAVDTSLRRLTSAPSFIAVDIVAEDCRTSATRAPSRDARPVAALSCASGLVDRESDGVLVDKVAEREWIAAKRVVEACTKRSILEGERVQSAVRICW